MDGTRRSFLALIEQTERRFTIGGGGGGGIANTEFLKVPENYIIKSLPPAEVIDHIVARREQHNNYIILNCIELLCGSDVLSRNVPILILKSYLL
jgi:hypothetical protein